MYCLTPSVTAMRETRTVHEIRRVEKRLVAWEREAETNQHGLAHLAPNVITDLRAALAPAPRAPETESPRSPE